MSQVFSFQNHSIRTIIENGQPWFVGRDIALLLGYTKTDKEIRRICKHVKLFKGTKLVPLGNSPRGFLIIPESDVWRLIIRSTLDKAQKVEEWIMSEVLPSIRQTGKYEAKPKQKALPGSRKLAVAASQPSYREKCSDITARLIALRGEMFRVTSDMSMVFRNPFCSAVSDEHREFAMAMNYAIQNFCMSITKEFETAELLFTAYVEAETLLRK